MNVNKQLNEIISELLEKDIDLAPLKKAWGHVKKNSSKIKTYYISGSIFKEVPDFRHELYLLIKQAVDMLGQTKRPIKADGFIGQTTSEQISSFCKTEWLKVKTMATRSVPRNEKRNLMMGLFYSMLNKIKNYLKNYYAGVYNEI